MPDETLDDQAIRIINEALRRFGAGEIFATDEETELAGQVVPLYASTIDALLALDDWSFARKTYKLDARAAVADNGYDTAAKKFINGWRYSYILPGTRLSGPRRVLTDPRQPFDPLREFHLEEGYLFADRTPLWAVFTVAVAPSTWSALFRQAAIELLAGAFCVPVTHDKNLAATILERAQGKPEMNGRGGLVGVALMADMASAPRQAPFWRDPLTAARWG